MKFLVERDMKTLHKVRRNRIMQCILKKVRRDSVNKILVVSDMKNLHKCTK
jgi:hypothetical protein